MTEEYRKPQIGVIPEFNSVFEGDQRDLVIIIPTAEEDAESGERLIDFIKSYKNNFFPDARLLTDEEALNSDLSNKNIIVFGTPWGNLFLKKYIHQIPLDIGHDKIIVGKEYKGDNFQFVTKWVNPLNNNMSMAIFTAQKPGNIIKINTIKPGRGFTIAKNYRTIRLGDYVNIHQIWIVND